MGIDIKQNTDGSAGLQGAGYGQGEFILDGRSWAATSVTSPSFVTSRVYVLKSVIGRVESLGTDAGAVTATLYMAPSGTALSAGTAISGAINLKGTQYTNQDVSLTPAPQIPAGYAVGLVFSGVLTAAAGGMSVGLCPA